MEFFPDGEHVRLRSPEQGTYLHADEDGWGVSLSPHRASLNTAWAVHLVPRAQLGITDVLLYSAAYGRYLGLRNDYAPPQDHPIGFLCLVQCRYNTPVQVDIMWQVQVTEDGNGGVFLRHREAGNRNPLNNLPLAVEPIPPRLAPPAMPDQIPNGAVAPMPLRRMIRYIRADNAGIFILSSRGTLEFNGRSLHYLIDDLAHELNDDYNNVILCVRAGSLGRATSLVIDLPLSEEPMEIVVLTTGSAVAMALRHPDVDAPAP